MGQSAKAVLEGIVARRRHRLDETRARRPLVQVQGAAEARCERRNFVAALREKPSGVIAELKKASPTRGVLRSDYRPTAISQAYEAAGATALSVLTEEDFFMGSLEHLQEAREAVSLPVLRKDFILDAYQVFESVAAGADAVLLIVAMLADCDLRKLLELCDRTRLAALVEVHTAEELDRALAVGARMIGVNNRNLKTMEVNLDTSFRLRAKIPSNCLAVSESGIKDAEDLHRLFAAGFHGVLIGERLMAGPNPGHELAALLEGVRTRADSRS